MSRFHRANSLAAPAIAEEAMRLPVDDFAGARFHLAKWVERPHSDRSDVGTPQIDAGSEIVLALRLLHDGAVAAPIGAHFPPLEQPEIATDSSWGTFRVDDCQPSGSTDVYELRETDIEPLAEIVSEIAAVRAAGASDHIATAFRRFNFSYERVKNEDLIIDLVIALESSLLSGIGDKEGLSFRMSLRGAALLRSRRQPVLTFSMFKELYDARSAIVHSGATLDALFSRQNRSKKRAEVLVGPRQR